jgi:PIN domain nuclease of toxin-antitoxin system
VILVDTQCWLWWFAQPERLSEEAITHLADETNEVWFSVASVWEMGIKVAIRKLPLPESIDSYLSSRMVQLGARSLFNFSNSCSMSGCVALASPRSF